MMVNPEGLIHGETHYGVLAADTAMVQGILCPAVNVEEFVGLRGG